MNATWDQFDFERRVWTKPAHTTKQKRTEHVPLSGAATVLLENWKKQMGNIGDNVFPGNVPGMPLHSIKRFWEEVRTAANLTGQF